MFKTKESKQVTDLRGAIAMHEQAYAELRIKADAATTELDQYRAQIYNQKKAEMGPRAGQQYLRDEDGMPRLPMAPMVILDSSADYKLQELEKNRLHWESEYLRIGRKIGELKKLLAQAQAAQ